MAPLTRNRSMTSSIELMPPPDKKRTKLTNSTDLPVHDASTTQSRSTNSADVTTLNVSTPRDVETQPIPSTSNDVTAPDMLDLPSSAGRQESEAPCGGRGGRGSGRGSRGGKGGVKATGRKGKKVDRDVESETDDEFSDSINVKTSEDAAWKLLNGKCDTDNKIEAQVLSNALRIRTELLCVPTSSLQALTHGSQELSKLRTELKKNGAADSLGIQTQITQIETAMAIVTDLSLPLAKTTMEKVKKAGTRR